MKTVSGSKPGDKRELIKIIGKTIALNWSVDKRFIVLAGITILLGSLIPLGLSYTLKLVLDELVHITTVSGTITTAVISYFALRYFLEGLNSFENVFLYQYTQRLTRYKIQNYLNIELSKRISTLDVDHFENPKTQDLIDKVKRESFWRIPEYSMDIFFTLSYGTGLVVSILALAPYGYWIPFAAIAITYPSFRLRQERASLEWNFFNDKTPTNRKLGELSSILQGENRVIETRIFGAREPILRRIVKLQNIIFDSMGNVLSRYMRKLWIPILIESIFILLLVIYKLPTVAAGLITVGSFTFFIQMLDRVMSNSQSLSSQISDLFEGSRYCRNYFELMDLPPLVVDKHPGHEFEEIKPPKIEFQNLSFTYPNGTNVLKQVSFTIMPGEHLAIVGPNGAGKSTLIKLLLRFYDPTKGNVMINDFDLKEIKRANWYKFVGTLFQTFGKYSLTIKENIAFSELDDPDDNKVKNAARLSGADEFIEKFKNKYDQQLGRQFDGEELSVGQWQKLALARAFYEAAPVLILDEPTSAIDAEAEADIFDNLNKVYKDKTLIFVSHRFSTVRHADKIIVLKDGKISEEGTHEKLMELNGIYARMFKKQAKGYIE